MNDVRGALFASAKLLTDFGPEDEDLEIARNLKEFIATLSPDERAAIDARYQELRQEVEGLRELRQIAGKAQDDVANALNIKPPSVSKIERQADMYLSTLRSYVEAVGGTLELRSGRGSKSTGLIGCQTRISPSPARGRSARPDRRPHASRMDSRSLPRQHPATE